QHPTRCIAGRHTALLNRKGYSQIPVICHSLEEPPSYSHLRSNIPPQTAQRADPSLRLQHHIHTARLFETQVENPSSGGSRLSRPQVYKRTEFQSRPRTFFR